MMGWWTRRNDRDENDRSLAGWLLDDALCVFGALHAAAADDPRVDGELRELLRTTAFGVLDDVTRLASLVGGRTVPQPQPTMPTVPTDGASAVRAVQALSDYAERLAEIALVSCYRQDDASMVFSELAADAGARMETLVA
jgi:hypothetical protein